MAKNYISLFDIIGPIMVGPSSSHTSGAASIAWMARQIFDDVPASVVFTLYGSFAETYKGHGTDRALVGGILRYQPENEAIRDAFQHAEEEGINVEFIIDIETHVDHPNTVDIYMEDADGHTLSIRGESIGGGRVHITRMNDIDVDFTGEYSTMIIGHRDEQGMLAYVTGLCANHGVNIAFMKNFRDGKGEHAFTVIESDEALPEELKNELLNHKSIDSVNVIDA